jgi:hypothetical protein
VIREQPRTGQYVNLSARIRKKDEAYQLLTLVYVHESAQVVKDLHPALGYILSHNVVTDFKPHERLAQQYRRAQATFRCFYVARSNNQCFEQRVEYTLKDVCNVSTGYNHKRPEDRA